MLEELSDQERNAAQMALEYANIEPSDTNLRHYLSWEILTFSHDERGHYCWYIDENGNEICIHVETLEEMDVTDF